MGGTKELLKSYFVGKGFSSYVPNVYTETRCGYNYYTILKSCIYTECICMYILVSTSSAAFNWGLSSSDTMQAYSSPSEET